MISSLKGPLFRHQSKDQLQDYFSICALSPKRTRPLVLTFFGLFVVCSVVLLNLQLTAFKNVVSSFIRTKLTVNDLQLHPTIEGRFINSESQGNIVHAGRVHSAGIRTKTSVPTTEELLGLPPDSQVSICSTHKTKKKTQYQREEAKRARISCKTP